MAFRVYTVDSGVEADHDFDSDEVEFASGKCRLKTGFFGSSIVTMDTDVDRDSPWDRTRLIRPVLAEAAGYEHRFLVSFDSGTTWSSYIAGQWMPVPLAAAFSRGMTSRALGDVTDIPEGTPIRLAFAIQRQNIAGPPDGWLDGFEILYLEADDPIEAFTDVMREVPADTEGLDEVPQQYVYPFDVEPVVYTESCLTEKGYTLACATATQKVRDQVSLTSEAMSRADAETFADFFRDHFGAAVKLRTLEEELGEDEFRFFTPTSEPSLSQKGLDAWVVTVRLTELIART